jgi:hypothetical protein
VGDNYATRIRGYVCPPVSGNYVFYIASDDGSDLYLSTDENPSNKQRIAFVRGWTQAREWNKYASQQSLPINLVAGQKYYVEATHAEKTTGDHLSVGWLLPGGTLEAPIPGARLSPFVPTQQASPIVSITSPANNAVFTAGLPIQIQAQASDVYGFISKVEFFANEVKIGEDLAAPYQYSWSNATAGTYIVTARATDDDNMTATSSGTTVVVSEPDPVICESTGSILREYWAEVTEGLTSLPLSRPSTSTSQLPLFEGPVNVGNNYASRIRGYVCPPVSGNYVFYIASDDGSDLYLSTDENPSNKQRIAFVRGWTNAREWNKYASQQSLPINLVAGQKYYVEVNHKERVGKDNISVGWQLPDSTLEAPIPGKRLSPFISTESARLSNNGDNGQSIKQPTIEAYPNPFMKKVTITFTGASSEQAILNIYDLRGVLVEQLYKGKVEAGKSYSVEFDGSQRLSGVYICRLIHGKQIINIKLVLLK